jgi:beta-lactamase class A
MSIFRKAEIEEESEEVVQVIKKVKKIDGELEKKPRKKKEPPKPWGRKERMMVLILLLVTSGASFVLALSAREWKLPGLPRLVFPNMTIFQESTIVVEGDNPNGRISQKAEKIKNAFHEITESQSGIYGLYVSELNSGYSFGVNDTETFQAASLIKLPVLAALYSEAEKGSIDLDQEYRLKNSDKRSGAGSLSYKQEGYVITFRQMAELMGKQSDNTAFNIVRNTLSDQIITSYTKSYGMIATDLDENETTPQDIGQFFKKLFDGELVSSTAKEEILDYLTDTAYEKWITAGVPEDVRVSHKYGSEIHVVNDAGIVFSEDPYVLVITTKGVVEKDANEILPQISKMVYEVMTE